MKLNTAVCVWHKIQRTILHSRFPVGIILILLGLARINPFEIFPKIGTAFGNDMLFGSLLFASGVMTLVTFPWRLRLGGKLAVVCAAACNAAWGFAVFGASPISAAIAAVLTVVLLVEAGANE